MKLQKKMLLQDNSPPKREQNNYNFTIFNLIYNYENN